MGNNKAQPFDAMLEGGLTELVGVDEEVNTDDYGASVEVSFGGPLSGEILNLTFYSTEDGSGSVQTPTGTLLILDADPSVSAGDTALAAAEWPTVIGFVEVSSADWISDANGAAARIDNQPLSFHEVASLFFVWLHEDATDLNDAAGDDEQLEFNFWYRRDS